MKIPFSKLAFIGTDKLEDPLDFQRVLFVNILSSLGLLISLFDSILLLFEGLYLQGFITLLSFVLYGLILFLNKLGQYQITAYLFLFFSLTIVSIVTMVAYEQGRFNETENVLIALMTASYFLLKNRTRLVGFWLVFLILIGFKFLKQNYLNGDYDFTFWLTLQNITILCVILFFSIDAFRKSLMKALNNLKTKDEILYSMIDNVPVFIALLDTEMRYKMVNLNYEKSFGMKRDEIIGSRAEDVLPANILETHLPMLKAALNGESPEFIEKTDMPDGSSFYAGGKYLPIKSENGDILGATVFVNDLTKLETAKIKLKEANETKDRLFSIVAHDIRGPLDLFEGLINVSKDGVITGEEFLEHQEKVREKLSALRETVNTLLDWARSQLDGINANPSKVNVNRIIESNVELYKELVHKKKIKLKVDVPKDLDAWIDENHFKISVRNLLHNALKFTPKDGEVSTLVRKNDDKITMSIKDTGVGMDFEKINSIMKKELQKSRSGTGGELGTGLGLSLSLGLLEKNNCTVSISSEPNNGTEIKIQIPYRLQKN